MPRTTVIRLLRSPGTGQRGRVDVVETGEKGLRRGKTERDRSRGVLDGGCLDNGGKGPVRPLRWAKHSNKVNKMSILTGHNLSDRSDSLSCGSGALQPFPVIRPRLPDDLGVLDDHPGSHQPEDRQ